MSPQRRAEPIPPSLRKPPAVARESFQQANTGSAQNESTSPAENTLRKSQRRQGKPVENKLSFIGIKVSDQDRELIKQQLFRCLGKYDPRAIPRIISKRTGITEQAVDYVLQMTVKEFEEWQREIRAALVRADEVSAAVWRKRSA